MCFCFSFDFVLYIFVLIFNAGGARFVFLTLAGFH